LAPLVALFYWRAAQQGFLKGFDTSRFDAEFRNIMKETQL
jgi:hypothetical protein